MVSRRLIPPATMEPVMPLHLVSTAVATVLEWLAAYGESH